MNNFSRIVDTRNGTIQDWLFQIVWQILKSSKVLPLQAPKKCTKKIVACLHFAPHITTSIQCLSIVIHLGWTNDFYPIY